MRFSVRVYARGWVRVRVAVAVWVRARARLLYLSELKWRQKNLVLKPNSTIFVDLLHLSDDASSGDTALCQDLDKRCLLDNP